MIKRDDVREFLATRCARISPRDVGLLTHGANRRAHDALAHVASWAATPDPEPADERTLRQDVQRSPG